MAPAQAFLCRYLWYFSLAIALSYLRASLCIVNDLSLVEVPSLWLLLLNQDRNVTTGLGSECFWGKLVFSNKRRLWLKIMHASPWSTVTTAHRKGQTLQGLFSPLQPSLGTNWAPSAAARALPQITWAVCGDLRWPGRSSRRYLPLASALSLPLGVTNVTNFTLRSSTLCEHLYRPALETYFPGPLKSSKKSLSRAGVLHLPRSVITRTRTWRLRHLNSACKILRRRKLVYVWTKVYLKLPCPHNTEEREEEWLCW